ncbi:hypothetical protein C8R47DRAFT_1076657 [Mycena vitilis]|nr:hypothetical protein C8R47DRAFT_1076657 [Mycena vitilis]
MSREDKRSPIRMLDKCGGPGSGGGGKWREAAGSNEALYWGSAQSCSWITWFEPRVVNRSMGSAARWSGKEGEDRRADACPRYGAAEPIGHQRRQAADAAEPGWRAETNEAAAEGRGSRGAGKPPRPPSVQSRTGSHTVDPRRATDTSENGALAEKRRDMGLKCRQEMREVAMGFQIHQRAAASGTRWSRGKISKQDNGRIANGGVGGKQRRRRDLVAAGGLQGPKIRGSIFFMVQAGDPKLWAGKGVPEKRPFWEGRVAQPRAEQQRAGKAGNTTPATGTGLTRILITLK